MKSSLRRIFGNDNTEKRDTELSAPAVKSEPVLMIDLSSEASEAGKAQDEGVAIWTNIGMYRCHNRGN